MPSFLAACWLISEYYNMIDLTDPKICSERNLIKIISGLVYVELVRH